MMNYIKKHIYQLLLLSLGCFILVACDNNSKKIDVNNANDNYVRVGVMVGSEEELMKAAQKVAAKNYDLNIEVIPYLYATQLNKALIDKEIDANIFQYAAYLDYTEKQHGYQLDTIGSTFIYPMGIYSRKYTSVLQVPNGAIVAIPNEPTNEARALFLLQRAGLIRMESNDNLEATTADIVSNPRQLSFKKLPSNALVDVLPNVDLAVINAGFALAAGLLPSPQALVIETKNANYANVIAIRPGQQNDPGLKALVQIMHSPEIEHAANSLFKGQAIPAWK